MSIVKKTTDYERPETEIYHVRITSMLCQSPAPGENEGTTDEPLDAPFFDSGESFFDKIDFHIF